MEEGTRQRHRRQSALIAALLVAILCGSAPIDLTARFRSPTLLDTAAQYLPQALFGLTAGLGIAARLWSPRRR